MDGPPEHALERSVWEGLLSYRARKDKMMAINGSLLGVYGSLLAAGGGDSTDIDDLIREMTTGL
jgi:hypothetical protein